MSEDGYFPPIFAEVDVASCAIAFLPMEMLLLLYSFFAKAGDRSRFGATCRAFRTIVKVEGIFHFPAIAFFPWQRCFAPRNSDEKKGFEFRAKALDGIPSPVPDEYQKYIRRPAFFNSLSRREMSILFDPIIAIERARRNGFPGARQHLKQALRELRRKIWKTLSSAKGKRELPAGVQKHYRRWCRSKLQRMADAYPVLHMAHIEGIFFDAPSNYYSDDALMVMR